jgi:hypothetical protein
MKKIILSLIILLSISVKGQQIPNGNFENWIQETYGEEPANWGELSLQLYNSLFLGILDSTIVKSSDAYSGAYAMELRSKIPASTLISDTIIPVAMLNLKNENLDSANMNIDSNLLSLSGYVKQDIVNSSTNSTSISVLVYSESGDMTGLGAIEFDNNIPNYTLFNIPILYFDSVGGDYLEIYITAGNSDFPVAGNSLKLDGLVLNYDNSTNIMEESSLKFKVFPNPTSHRLQIESNSIADVYELRLFNISGDLLQTTQSKTINLENYKTGVYLLKVTCGNSTKEFKIFKK